MKKFICLAVIICTVLGAVYFSDYQKYTPTAYAEEGVIYKRVVTTDTPFYSDENKTRLLFFLPYTYFVKVLEVLGELTHVECYGNALPKIDGYVPTDALLDWATPPLNPYPDFELTTAKACNLYSDKNLTESIQVIFADRQLAFIGTYHEDGKENAYMVYYNRSVGYVKESDLLPFELPLHPEPMPSGEKEEGVEISTPTFASDTILRYAVIGCLLLAGIIALIFSLRKKNKPAVTFDGESDYE